MQIREAKRAAALLVNEWICVTGQYEKTLSRIGRDLYRAYQKGHVIDEDACGYCLVLEGIFTQAKSMRDDLRFDILCRFSSLDSERVKLHKAKNKVGAFLSQSLLGYWDQINLPKYKEAASGTIFDLSNRALSCADRGTPLLDSKEHERLCSLALALEKECKKSWDKIVQLQKENRNNKGLALSTLSVQLLMQLGKYARKSKYGKLFIRILKYNDKVETSKLLSRFADRPEGEILREQLGYAFAN